MLLFAEIAKEFDNRLVASDGIRWPVEIKYQYQVAGDRSLIL
jgi:hypothetical protein